METKTIDELIAYLERVQNQATQGAQLSLAEVDMLLKHLRKSAKLRNEALETLRTLLDATSSTLYRTDPNRYEEVQS